MTTPKDTIKFAFSFPQGLILMTERGGAYFNPPQSEDAFMIWGERKELFGKNAITVQQNYQTGARGYSVVYEFAQDGALSDCRLVSGNDTFAGKLVDAKTLSTLNDALAADALTLYNPRDTQPPTVYNAARFPDGRLLIQLSNRNELYLGTPGNYEKLDAHLTIQGGGSKYYKTAKGESIELPYGLGGPGYDDVPKFAGQELVYVNTRGHEKPSDFGLEFPAGKKHLDPFSPELQPAQPKAAPKPPGM